MWAHGSDPFIPHFWRTDFIGSGVADTCLSCNRAYLQRSALLWPGPKAPHQVTNTNTFGGFWVWCSSAAGRGSETDITGKAELQEIMEIAVNFSLPFSSLNSKVNKQAPPFSPLWFVSLLFLQHINIVWHSYPFLRL